MSNAPQPPVDGDVAGPAPTGPSDGPRVTGEQVRDLGRMRRTRGNRKIAGVAGGIARHFDIDPLVVRVTLVVLAFFGGAGLIVYVACWLLVPYDDADEAAVRLDTRSRTLALTIAGVLATLALLGDSLGGWSFPWPLAIIGTIVLLVMLARGRDREAAFAPPTWTGPGWVPGPAAPGGPGGPTATAPPATAWPYAPPGPPTTATTATTPMGPMPPVPPPPTGTGWSPYPPPVPPTRPRRRGPLLFWYALALIVIGLGVLGMVDLAGADVAGSAYPAVALATSGVMLLLGAFWGRAGGLILLGLISALATAGATAAGEVDGGHVIATPPNAASVQSDYRLDAGEIELDLTQVSDLEALDGTTIVMNVDLGRIAVTIPRGLDVTIDSQVSLGERLILGTQPNGDSGTNQIEGGTDAPHVDLDVTVGLGQIEIIREGAN